MNIKTKVFRGWKISYVNEVELDEMLNELYNKNYYRFMTSKKDPVIYDVGALIGETVIFFKNQFPNAKVTAFEPSPRSFKLLKKNTQQNHLSDVRLINAAVSNVQGYLNFYIDTNTDKPWGRGDSLKRTRFTNPHISKVVKVPAVKLSRFINKNIDLLKIDIEGAETEVIQEIESKLKYVKQIILEYHASIYNPENNFGKIMEILKKHGYETKIFVSRWLLPNFAVNLVPIFLSVLKVDEYWLRIYAKH